MSIRAVSTIANTSTGDDDSTKASKPEPGYQTWAAGSGHRSRSLGSSTANSSKPPWLAYPRR